MPVLKSGVIRGYAGFIGSPFERKRQDLAAFLLPRWQTVATDLNANVNFGRWRTGTLLAHYFWKRLTMIHLRQASMVREVTSGIKLGLTFAVLLAGSSETLAASPPMQSLDEISVAAAEFVRKQGAGVAANAKVMAEPLDPRLRLPACTENLQAFSNATGLANGPRQVVGVRCTGERPWKVYVTVTVERSAWVVVASQYLERGRVIGADDLKRIQLNTRRLPRNIVSDTEQLIGKRLKQAIEAGSPITRSEVTSERLVRRGQRVDILSALPGIKVRMAGIARSDGAKGERIVVRNLSSGRDLEARVSSVSVVIATTL